MKKSHALWACLVFVLGLVFILHAQETEITSSQAEPLPITGRDVAAFSSLSEAELAALTSELDAAPLIPFAALAPDEIYGNFFSLQNPDSPPLPADLSGSDVWKISGPNNAFLLNDLGYNYLGAGRESLARGGMQPMELSETTPDYGTNLYLARISLAAGYLTGIASNTLVEVPYELQSRTNLGSQSDWQFEGFILGSEITNWTPWSVAQGNRTNLFLRLRSWADDGTGLPIWWQQQYGVSDPYGDPDGDGWNNLAEFFRGTSPVSFNTPAAPHGVAVHYNPSSGMATVTWQPAPGPVTGYAVKDSSGNTTNLSASTTQWQKIVPNIPNGGNGNPTVYKSFQVQAHYAGGNSAFSELVPLEQDTVSGRLAFGSGNSTYLSVSALPANAATLRLIQVEVHANALGDYSFNATNEISVSMLTNGSFLIPTNWLPPIQAAQAAYGTAYFNWWLQASNTDASASAGAFAWGDYYSTAGDALAIPYFDGREQLKQNLIFQLRSGLDIPVNILGFDSNDVWAGLEYDLPTNNYAHADFYDYGGTGYFPQRVFDLYLPFEQNYFYRNFVFNLTETDPNGLLASFDTGFTDHASIQSDFIALGLLEPPPFRFQPPATSGTTIASLLATNQTRWLLMAQPDFVDNLGNGPIGMFNSEGTNYLATNFRNRFGLEFLSTKMAWGNSSSETYVLYPGEETTFGGWFYSETAQPQFSTVEYDFFSPYGIWNEATQTLIDPTMPGLPSFSPTNQSQLFIVSPGGGTRIAGYAKLAVVNGYAGVYGYLGQYFDKAYKITNGIVTTNTTGFLSPYGDFVATEPGPAALVTMPDLDTGERGTCTVYAVSLQLDKNHDGSMDLSFTGADATSQASPMRFWVNNDWDMSFSASDLGHDVYSQVKDYNDGFIESQRDLEDFARLWICGMPALPAGQSYSVTLSMSAQSGAPAINLFDAAETNGGTAYLTDTNAASAQAYYSPFTFVGPGYKIATISSGQSFTFPASYFTNGGSKYFLFEGAGIGAGQLVLTIADNYGNTIAQTGVWLDLHDVKDFYEQAHITGVPTTYPEMVNSTNASTFVSDHELPSSLLESDQLIVFVHGWRMGQWDYENFSDTMFKRLYWQGYQGRFASLRWPTLSADDFKHFSKAQAYLTYNRSEYMAFRSAQGASDYFDWLKSRFPEYSVNVAAHSMGNIVMMETLKLQLAAGHHAIDNYVLMQAAVPAHCYDGNAPVCPALYLDESPPQTPNTYLNYPGAITNAINGTMVNFFNTDDYALSFWVENEDLNKPDGSLGYYIVPTLQPYKLLNTPVTDPREIMALVARPRSFAVGAQEGVEQNINGGELDLFSLGFRDKDYDHSGEFNRNIQDTVVQLFYPQLRSKLFP